MEKKTKRTYTKRQKPLTKLPKTPESVFSAIAEKRMEIWDLKGFKRKYRRLFKVIIEAMETYKNQ